MKIALIHSTNSGFFPRFCRDIQKVLCPPTYSLTFFLPRSGNNIRYRTETQILWGSRFNWFVHFHLYRITGLQDVWSLFSTLDLIHKLKSIHPDIIHLHIVNEWDICFPLFVRFLNKYGKPVIWTFHDSRAITAKCYVFDDINCCQWINGCKHCPPNACAERSFVNCENIQWSLRKKWLTSINNLSVVTPSEWMAGVVHKSFLKDVPLRKINNGIDTSCFSSGAIHRGTLFKDYVGKKIVLGVANGWHLRKGVESMLWLSNHLPDAYQIVMVGRIPEDYLIKLRDKIIHFPVVEDVDFLVSIYQSSDVFVNPTLADNFPTVNIEALASGLPVVTFKTGGSAESIDDTCGIAIEKGDNEGLCSAVMQVCTNPSVFTRENCIARASDYSLAQYEKYGRLYSQVSNSLSFREFVCKK